MCYNLQQLLWYTLLVFKLSPPPASSNQYHTRTWEVPRYFPVTVTENARCTANATAATRWHLLPCWASISVGQIVFRAGGRTNFTLCLREVFIMMTVTGTKYATIKSYFSLCSKIILSEIRKILNINFYIFLFFFCIQRTRCLEIPDNQFNLYQLVIPTFALQLYK